MEQAKQPAIGQIVKILRGRESGEYAVVIGLEEERFAWIADGDRRKFDHPKKKNLHHLELQHEISDVVAGDLRDTGRVTNGKLRHVLAKYLQETKLSAHAKGE